MLKKIESTLFEFLFPKRAERLESLQEGIHDLIAINLGHIKEIHELQRENAELKKRLEGEE